MLRFSGTGLAPIDSSNLPGVVSTMVQHATEWFSKPLHAYAAKGVAEDKSVACTQAADSDAVHMCSQVLQVHSEITQAFVCAITHAVGRASGEDEFALFADVCVHYTVAEHPYRMNWLATIMCTFLGDGSEHVWITH